MSKSFQIMITLINQLRTQLHEELVLIDPQSTNYPLDAVQKNIAALQTTINAIKEVIDSYKFADSKEEINFFKNVLPEFQSELIYYITIEAIERKKPEGSKCTMGKYYFSNLNKITAYFNEHKDFFEYYRTGATYLDPEYFLRGDNFFALTREAFAFALDHRYCTIGCYMASVVLSHQRLQQYLNEQLSVLAKPLPSTAMKDPSIKWTDTRAALEELTYAFYFKGSFNNGQVEIKTIYNALCQFFGLSPGNIYKAKQDFYGRSNIAAYQEVLHKRYKDGMEETDDRYGRK